MNIPTLHTERLTLRAFGMEDYPAFAAFHSGPASGAPPLPPREIWRHFCAHLGHWPLRGFGWWAIEAQGTPVGFAGIHEPPSHPEPELGWVLFEEGRGKGYATEAATAARDWWYARGETRIASNIDRDNAPSIAVARRMGATTDGASLAHNPSCTAWLHEAPV